MSPIAHWFCLIAGGFFLFCAACLIVQRLLFLARAQVAEGEVIDQRPSYQKPVQMSARTARGIGIFAFFADLFFKVSTQSSIDPGAIAADARRDLQPGQTTSGSTVPGNRTLHFPHVRFPVGDRLVEFTHPAGADVIQYPTGTKVSVLYLPDQAENAMIRSLSNLWIPVIIMAILGGGLLGAGLFVAVKHG